MSIQLSHTVAPKTDTIGSGFSVVQFRHNAFAIGAMSPFVMVDHFHMWKPTFDIHPHAGFSAVTMVFEDTVGQMTSRDSIGHNVNFGAGDLHWTLAGSGILHTQLPIGENANIHALQIFVNLPGNLKNIPPDSFRVPREQMPLIERDGVRVRVVAGEIEDKQMAIKAPCPILMLDIYLDGPGKRLDIPLPNEWNAWVFVIDGVLNINDAKELRAGEAICASADSAEDRLGIEARRDVHCVVLAAPRIDEPVIARGPFVFESEASLEQAISRFNAGHFGEVPSNS